MVGPVEHVASVEVHRAQTQTKAVGPLAAAALARVEQLARVVVSWKASSVATLGTPLKNGEFFHLLFKYFENNKNTYCVIEQNTNIYS
jgi:hypothetical protein